MTDTLTDSSSPARHIKVDVDLVEVLDTQNKRFADGAIDLSTEETDQLKAFTELARMNISTIKKNSVLRRARLIVRDFAAMNRRAFFLCALGTKKYNLGRLNSITYMEAVTRWAREATQWPGVDETMNKYAQFLPPTVAAVPPMPPTTAAPVPGQDVATIRLSALRRAMDCIPDQDITVLIPHDGSGRHGSGATRTSISRVPRGCR